MATYNLLRGIALLTVVSVIWGSSFPAIKLVMYDVNEHTYTWVRGLIATSFLMPYIMYRYAAKSLTIRDVKGGLITGTAYALGLWLQAWGTKFTTASNSAFITGLSVVFVHVYTAVFRRKYGLISLTSLILSLLGLYMLTTPSGGFNFGDLIVLMGAFMWAAQIVLVSRFSSSDSLVFTYFEMLPTVAFIIPDYLGNRILNSGLSATSLFLLTYLAIMCSDVAFALQVVGQRYVTPDIASLVFLLEPVSASVMAYLILSETMTVIQALGAFLILIAIMFSTDGFKYLSTLFRKKKFI